MKDLVGGWQVGMLSCELVNMNGEHVSTNK
jgi:hypothetical protein